MPNCVFFFSTNLLWLWFNQLGEVFFFCVVFNNKRKDFLFLFFILMKKKKKNCSWKFAAGSYSSSTCLVFFFFSSLFMAIIHSIWWPFWNLVFVLFLKIFLPIIIPQRKGWNCWSIMRLFVPFFFGLVCPFLVCHLRNHFVRQSHCLPIPNVS